MLEKLSAIRTNNESNTALAQPLPKGMPVRIAGIAEMHRRSLARVRDNANTFEERNNQYRGTMLPLATALQLKTQRLADKAPDISQ